jgi:hypothetical protein
MACARGRLPVNSASAVAAGVALILSVSGCTESFFRGSVSASMLPRPHQESVPERFASQAAPASPAVPERPRDGIGASAAPRDDDVRPLLAVDSPTGEVQDRERKAAHFFIIVFVITVVTVGGLLLLLRGT